MVKSNQKHNECPCSKVELLCLQSPPLSTSVIPQTINVHLVIFHIVLKIILHFHLYIY